MIFKETKLKGAFEIEIERREDNRGYFGRSFCQKEFGAHGLKQDIAQINVSFNHKRGTLRGMHFQRDPYQEVKIIRCTRGAIHDVIIDLRKNSPTYLQWIGVDLTEENGKMLYVPEDFAHGYYTLKDGSEVIYFVTQFYQPGAEGGVRYDDPAFKIQWPGKPSVLSDKDQAWPAFSA